MGALPDGTSLPLSRSAIAGPPMVPGWKQYSMASQFSRSRSMVSGRPAITTTTTGLPLFATSAISSLWAPWRCSCEREWASPERVESQSITKLIKIPVRKRHRPEIFRPMTLIIC